MADRVSHALDYPFEDIVEGAERQIKAGHTIFQKFTCDGCGTRQTMEEPNKLFTTGRCEECGHVTDIEAKGCGFLLVSGNSEDAFKDIMSQLFNRR